MLRAVVGLFLWMGLSRARGRISTASNQALESAEAALPAVTGAPLHALAQRSPSQANGAGEYALDIEPAQSAEVVREWLRT